MFIAPPDDLTPEQATYLAAAHVAAAALASAYAHAHDFAAMLWRRHGQRLDDWIAPVSDA